MSSFALVTDVLTGPLPDTEGRIVVSPLSPPALRAHGGRTALVDGSSWISYAQLSDMVDERRRELGDEPQLVVLHGTNSLDFVVTYLAALAGRHPVIVAANERGASSLTAAFGASVRVEAPRRGRVGVQRFARPAAMWHPDLAVMMSTSGSTGSPKLVRLSLDAVTSNATAIAQSLGLHADDRAITSLPLHYCYGLSVVTSHLAAGASVVLTDASVVDPCFWSAVQDHGVTTLSGVPQTFDLIDRLSDHTLASPSLRRVTQAGGRLAPHAVERLARIGDASGWELFVMYGQTEATARMTCLAPSRVSTSSSTVGVAIPGGHLRIEPLSDAQPGVGEVIYAGPNVMMGYATCAADLHRGHDLDELRTGDLGRFDADGNLQIVGRLSRFVKLHGKRIELDHVERELGATMTTPLHLAGDDEGVVLAMVDPAAANPAVDEAMRHTVADIIDVPPGRVSAVRLVELPLTNTGKTDGPALIEMARALDRRVPDERVSGRGESVIDAFAAVFGRRPGPADTFASLGGDSFSYVEMSIRLESALGSLPVGWHLLPVADLETIRLDRPTETAWHRWSRSVDTSVVIRAIGILLIVCTHMRIFRVAGGAHALLAVVGYNVARFQLPPRDIAGRARRALATVARIAIPTSAWIALNMVVVGGYSFGAVLLVNNYTGSGNRTDGRWEYWYFEAFVQIMIVLAIVFSFRRVRLAEQARPFAFAIGVLGITLLFRFEIVNLGGAYNEIFRPHTVACFVALGWCAQRAATTAQRLGVTALAGVTTLGYFETVGRVDQLDRELRILVAVLALVWIRSIRLPKPVAGVVGKIAAASMWIFLVHWQVWPLFTPWLDDRAAFAITIGVGVGVWWIAERVTGVVGARRQRRIVGRSTSSQVSTADTAINSSDATPVSA